MNRIGICVLGATVALAACNKKSPSSPTPVVPAVESITVTGPDTVLLGASATYTAAIAGGAPGATCSWSQDASFVGTVTNGTFTSVGNGVVTIWCEASGVRGTKRVTVIPNFGGRWTGTYIVTGCSSSGFFAGSPNACADFSSGRVLPWTAVLSQSGATVTGSFTLGSITASQQSGVIAGDGFSMLLTHEGTGSIRIQSRWDVRQAVANQMSGTLRQNWSASGFSGDMTVTADIGLAARTAASASGPRQTPVPSSLASLIDALRR